MKNIALALILTILVAACSSGTTVGDIPNNVTGVYRGNIESTNERSRGSVILNIAEDSNGDIIGNIIFELEFDGDDCLLNSTVAGGTSGFSVALSLVEGSITTTDADGETTTDTVTGASFQLTQANAGNTLTGTYVGASCSNSTGSGSIVLTR